MIKNLLCTDFYLPDTSNEGTIWSAWKKDRGPHLIDP